MTLDDLERQNRVVLWILGDFDLRHTFQEWIAQKSLKTEQDSLHMKFLALNVVLTSLNFAPPHEFKEHQTLKYSHLATQTAAATRDGGAI